MNGTSAPLLKKHISMFLMYSLFFAHFCLFHIFISLDGLLFQGRKVPTTKRVKTKGIPPISCMSRGPCARLFSLPGMCPKELTFFLPSTIFFLGATTSPSKKIFKKGKYWGSCSPWCRKQKTLFSLGGFQWRIVLRKFRLVSRNCGGSQWCFYVSPREGLTSKQQP